VVVKAAYGYQRGEMGFPDGGPAESKFCPSPSSQSSPTKIAEVRVSGLCSKVRTFIEILRSKPRLSEKKTDGVDLQSEAAGSVKSIRGSDVKGWAEHLLGLFN
jgi:hypothetical protein